MGNFGRDNNRGGGFSRGGFGRNNDRGGFGGGRSSFGGGRGGFSRRDDRGPREMFKTNCSNCGKDCEVPFRPTNGKPVYCSDCFEKMGNGGRSEERSFARPERTEFRTQAQAQSQPVVSNNAQLEALNAKLDKIISLLEPKVVEVVEAQKEKKTKVVKKTSTKK